MTKVGNYIRFDWAMKRLLRDKVNFGIIEGFLTSLLGEQIKIKEMLDSESNAEDEESKQNRVDVLAEGENGDLYLIEVQNSSGVAYFQRMLFGTSQLVTQYIHRGEDYQHIRKIYSINIVYFHLGGGTDYVYHGTTEFRGLHNNELLNLSRYQMKRFEVDNISDLFPEYYILRVNDFDKVAKTPLDEWMNFLRTGSIDADDTAPGLDMARERLNVMNMSPEERRQYYKQIDDMVDFQNSAALARAEAREEGRYEGIYEGRLEGRREGIQEGRREGIQEGRREGIQEGRREGRQEAQVEIIRTMHSKGMTDSQIADLLNMPLDEVESILSSH